MNESDQIRDVYAHYGLAIYLAQCLEQSIFIHLMFFDFFPNNIRTFSNSELWQAEFDRYESQELGRTMGWLIQRMKEAGQPTEEIKISLAKALKHRNRLAHSYFSEQAIPFTSKSGRKSMIKELESIQEIFRSAFKEIDALTMPTARKYGFTEEMEIKTIQEMLALHAGQ